MEVTMSAVSSAIPSQISLSLDSSQLAEQYDALSDLQFANGRRLAAELDIRRGHRILDVGGGTGRLAEYVTALAGDPSLVAAIDPLPHRIDLARRRLGPSATLLVGRAEDLSGFADASFDHVVFNAVFHWIPDQPSALAEAARVLKPGGRVGITTGDRARPNTFQQIADEALRAGPHPEDKTFDWLPYRLTEGELRGLLESAGLKPTLIEVRSFTDHYQSAEQIFAFNASSSFGNFLKELSPERADAVRAAIAERLDAFRDDKGIALKRHTIFAVAEKP
jgi:arsenite methyltransferase